MLLCYNAILFMLEPLVTCIDILCIFCVCVILGWYGGGISLVRQADDDRHLPPAARRPEGEGEEERTAGGLPPHHPPAECREGGGRHQQHGGPVRPRPPDPAAELQGPLHRRTAQPHLLLEEARGQGLSAFF